MAVVVPVVTAMLTFAWLRGDLNDLLPLFTALGTCLYPEILYPAPVAGSKARFGDPQQSPAEGAPGILRSPGLAKNHN